MKGSILVVEDEIASAEVLAEILAGVGYDVRLAADGAQGLEAVAARRPDLVLLDVMMPAIDGREVLRVMKSDPALRDIPVVLMSAVPELLRTEPRPDGALAKPFLVQDVLSIVERLLAG